MMDLSLFQSPLEKHFNSLNIFLLIMRWFFFPPKKSSLRPKVTCSREPKDQESDMWRKRVITPALLSLHWEK